METSVPTTKRAHSETSSDIPLQIPKTTPSVSQAENARKKLKKKTETSNHTSEDDSTSENEHQDTDEVNNEISTQTQKLTLTELLAPTQTIFENELNKPIISFNDLKELIEQCDKPKNAPSVASEFTSDIPALITLLDQCYALIKDKKLRNRVTRMKNALAPSEKPPNPNKSDKRRK